MTKKIIILGTGGNCIDILDTIRDINNHEGKNAYECVGFLDDNERIWGQGFWGVRVLGPLESALDYKDCYFVNGIGSVSNFREKASIISKTGIATQQFASIVHPTASVSRMAELGYGTVVFQNAAITSNVRIGNHVMILPSSVISHDDVIGDYTTITGGACVSGAVRIGRSCYVGTNASILSNIVIGNYSLVGMGSVVLRDVPDNTVVIGNPARILRTVLKAEMRSGEK